MISKIAGAAGAAALLTLGACASTPPIQLQNTFKQSDFAWAKAAGNNTITGSAVLRTVGGEVRSCGGFEVDLIPAVQYSAERMAHLYGNAQRGYQPVPTLFQSTVTFANDPIDYQLVGRKSACDAQGNFEFRDLPDGGYFVVVPIVWSVPTGAYSSEPQGGRLMRRVDVAGGKTERVVLTQ